MRIIIRDNKMEAKPAMNAEQLTNTLLSTLYGQYQTVISKTPDEHKPEVAELLYDMFNQAASAFLENLIPDKELRPDLTEEAILAMENKILDNQSTKEGDADGVQEK